MVRVFLERLDSGSEDLEALEDLEDAGRLGGIAGIEIKFKL